MNRKLGLYSSAVAALCTILFLIGLFLKNDLLNYSTCLVLSWAYVLTCCSYACYADKDRRALTFGGVAIAVIYSVFTNLVNQHTKVTLINRGCLFIVLITKSRNVKVVYSNLTNKYYESSKIEIMALVICLEGLRSEL